MEADPLKLGVRLRVGYTSNSPTNSPASSQYWHLSETKLVSQSTIAGILPLSFARREVGSTSITMRTLQLKESPARLLNLVPKV
jgi:hypothetical protein